MTQPLFAHRILGPLPSLERRIAPLRQWCLQPGCLQRSDPILFCRVPPIPTTNIAFNVLHSLLLSHSMAVRAHRRTGGYWQELAGWASDILTPEQLSLQGPVTWHSLCYTAAHLDAIWHLPDELKISAALRAREAARRQGLLLCPWARFWTRLNELAGRVA